MFEDICIFLSLMISAIQRIYYKNVQKQVTKNFRFALLLSFVSTLKQKFKKIVIKNTKKIKLLYRKLSKQK